MTMPDPLYEDYPCWKSLPTECKGCGFEWGSFNVDMPRKCPRCAVYGTAYPPE